MWPFNTRTTNQKLADELHKAKSELAMIKARLRGIQDRCYMVKKNEAYYVIQTKNGKFSKMMLPFIGDEK